ncbi:MAG TPA: cyclic nucleotide-binding domain-containing protein [Kiritimatiellia bacterium]|nr:cyclic nucleotide-binding domain-containing protein [Kiritimatiellia bacterium]
MKFWKHASDHNISTRDTLHVVVVSLLAITLPLESFTQSGSPLHTLFFIIRWFGYIYFAIDLCLRYRSAEYQPGQPGRIWLLPDVFSALPIGPLLNATWNSAPGWLLIAAYMLPLLRLGRVYVTARTWQQQNPTVAGLRRIFTTLAFVLVIMHWIGCWQLAVYDHDQQAPMPLRYLQAVYWTITTMTTIGYGDITPDTGNSGQIMFTMLIMVIGAGVFGFIIGNIATIMSNLDFARNQHLDKMQRINTFLRYNKIPAPVRQRVNGYFSYLWQTRRGFDESTVLSELPTSLRMEVEMHLRRDIVTKVPFFRDADQHLLRAIVARLQPCIAQPGEFIIRKGDMGDSMFFIANGEVEVLGSEGKPVALLSDGNFFGEIALLERCPRGADVRAIKYCDLYKLDKSDVDDVIAQFPAFGAHIRSMADQRKTAST